MIGTIVNIQNRDNGARKPDSGRNPVPTRLIVQLDGQGPVKETLSHAVRETRDAVKRIGQILLSGRPDFEKTPDRRIEKECELFIISWDESQARAVLELSPPEAQLSLFADMGEESLFCFLEGLDRISGPELDPTSLPQGFDQEVLRSCHKLSELLNAGFNSIVFKAFGRSVSLGRSCRDNLCRFLINPPRLERWTLIGRLEALSGRGKLTGMVWDESGTRWICRFKREHLPHLSAAWMSCVELTGKATLEPNQDRVLEVESLAVPCSTVENGAGDGFPAEPLWSGDWESHDLEEIFSPEENPDEILKNILMD